LILNSFLEVFQDSKKKEEESVKKQACLRLRVRNYLGFNPLEKLSYPPESHEVES
jgi:hypothetical protein